MPLALAIAGLLVVAGPDAPAQAPTADAQAAYQEARSHSGRSPDDQVRLALWCEAHGLPAERLKHLALAVLADPRHAVARGLMGLVAYEGRWRRPEAVAEGLKADPARAALLAEYDAKRLRAPYTADGQMALGVWADERGLKDQARAHLTAAVRLDPSRELAWKRLGYRKHEGRWTTDARLAAEKAEAEAQKLADKHWKGTLDRAKSALDHPSKRHEAQATFDAIIDPRAVPSIARAFVTDRPLDQARAVRILGQIEGPTASRTLAALAVFAKSPDIRRAAIETLRQRDARDFVRLWIALIRKPIRYEVKPVGGPGSPGVLFVEGEKADVRRTYAPPPMPNLPNLAGGSLNYDANGLPVVTLNLGAIENREIRISPGDFNRAKALNHQQVVQASQQLERLPSPRGMGGDFSVLQSALSNAVAGPFNTIIYEAPSGNYHPLVERQLQIQVGEMAREVQLSAEVAKQQLAGDAASIDRCNAEIRRSNEPVLVALKAVTGADIGEDAVAWGRWWSERMGFDNGLAVTDNPNSTKPTLFEEVPLGYTPTATPGLLTGQTIGFVVHPSCFAGGTLIRTIEGDRAIESIRSGDLVLVQDTRGGALGYQPVVAVFHNPPNQTFRVDLGGEAVVATGIHRFWKAGKGWAMARDLKPGDVVRTLGGVATVASVEPARVQPVFNLEVAEGWSYFVGKLGALVHDNSPVEAVPHPFDATAAIAPAR